MLSVFYESDIFSKSLILGLYYQMIEQEEKGNQLRTKLMDKYLKQIGICNFGWRSRIILKLDEGKI